jgi:hypothetical protein
MFSRCDIGCWITIGVLKKKSRDFSKLKEVPEASLKSLRIDLILLSSWEVGVFRSIVSSTN